MAFDTVNFDILLNKLNNCCIKNIENIWVKNYLTNMVQFVQLLCGTLSHERVVTCGVPQGSFKEQQYLKFYDLFICY